MAAAGGHRLADRHEGRGQIGPAGIELQAPLVHDVLSLHDHLALGLGRVLDRPRHREELLHQLVHARTHARDVDGNVRHAVAVA